MALPPKVPPPPRPRYGVYGISWAQVPIRNITGAEDFPAGVYGESMFQGPGIFGLDHNGWGGIAGVSHDEYGTGVYGECYTPYGDAGYFVGDVTVNGTVNVNGNVDVKGELNAKIKHAIVPFPDGSKRLLHCMESPEHWFEDFGSARLTRGRATVKFDADFAKVVTLNGYRVFLTPEGDCHGLYVRKRGSSFEVRELQGGTSNVGFSYRIVAKRKDIKRHTRFAKIDTTIPILKGAARAGRGRKTARPSSRLFAALTKDARKKAAARKAAVRG
jgi:hypothetical protein